MRRILADRPLTSAERSARYRAAHPEQKVAHARHERERRRRNPEKHKAAQKRWRDKNKDHLNIILARHYRKNLVKYMLGRAKRRALKLNVPFNIERSDILIPSHCPVLGIPLVVGTGSPTDASPSLDRIQNDRGYVKDNIMVISYKANTIKSNATAEEITRVAEFYSNLGSV